MPRSLYKVPQEVMEQLLEVDQPNISLSAPVNGSYPCIRHELKVLVRLGAYALTRVIIPLRPLLAFEAKEHTREDYHGDPAMPASEEAIVVRRKEGLTGDRRATALCRCRGLSR